MPELDDQFMNEEFKPYLKGLFADFCLRSTPTTQQMYPGKSIDKVTFTEYINLPGIVSDRFFTLAMKDDKRVYEQEFLNLMTTVFNSSLEQKMSFVF